MLDFVYSSWILILAAVILIAILIILGYKRRMKSYLGHKFNMVSMRLFTLGQKLSQYEGFQDEYVEIHSHLDELQYKSTGEALRELDQISNKINLLQLALNARKKSVSDK